MRPRIMSLTILLFACLALGSVVTIAGGSDETKSELIQGQTSKPPETLYLIKPAHIFDGESAQLHDNWVVLVRGNKIEAVGPANEVKAADDAKVIDSPGMTLMPGLIDGQ